MLDVARLAGVSGKTVSRVINGDGYFSPDVAARVTQAVADLDFRPNIAARSLKSERSYNLCLLSEYLSSTYFAEIVAGAASACSERGYHLVIEQLHADRPRRSAMLGLLGRVSLDGFILLPPQTDDQDLLSVLDELKAPYVRISPASQPERSSCVRAEDALGVSDLADHLWRMGHRRFGYVSGPFSHAATHIRRESFIDALVKNGAERDAIRVAEMPPRLDRAVKNAALEILVQTGASGLDALLAHPDPPTAVFAFSDGIAFGVLSRAQTLGLVVPDQLAVAGFDDSEISKIVFPRLTTIRQPVSLMATAAVELLIDHPNPPATKVLGVELVIRGSTESQLA